MAGPNPHSVAVGDFNSEGKPDLAVACDGTWDARSQTFTNSGISVLLGKGDGTFQSAVITVSPPRDPVDLKYSRVAMGDFNGDGKPDLAVADANAADARYRGLIMLLGKGDGTFQPAVSLDLGFRAQPLSVAAGDFNGDAKLDLVLGSDDLDSSDPTTGRPTNHNISVLLGKGDSTFQAPFKFNVLDSPTSMAVGDSNGDGRLDVITAGHGSSFRMGATSLLLGNGDGSFRAASTYAGRSVISLAVGDFNGDRQLDFVTVVYNDLDLPAIVWLNTSCPSNPRLAVERAGNALTVSWPFSVAGFVLESSTNLNPSSWKPTDLLPVNKNGRWEGNVPTTQSQGYFRLRKP